MTTATMVLALVLGQEMTLAQVDQSRRELATPGLVLETGTRTSACDVLSFTNQGQFLLATGDDKVVHTWRFSAQGLTKIPDPAPAAAPQAVLRWTSHRERRGNIYAAAVSPDPKGQYIAIGGMGIRNSQWAVLDRYSGKIVNALPYLSTDPKLGGASIWAIAFSPSGRQVACGTGTGSIWVWDWQTSQKPQLIGQHAAPPNLDYNYVRFIRYVKDDLISADENGSVYRWTLGPNPSGFKLFDFSNHNEPGRLIRAFTMSPDSGWLAAALEKNQVEIRALANDQPPKILLFDDGQSPSALAFGPEGNKLAVSLRTVDLHAAFFKEIDHRVKVFDVQTAPRALASIKPSYRVEAVAFHPDGRHLATAGGLNHDVAVYDLARPAEPLGKPMAGPGQCYWSVALSSDGRYLGFQSDRNPDPPDPNHQGAGPRRVFDLQRRLFSRNAGFDWTPLLDKSPDGWTVKFSATRADQWFAQSPEGKLWPLPWETKIEEFPRCYAFLPKSANHANRLVVGHLYGASMYDLTPAGAFRTRILSGHDSEVTGLAVSADGKRLITCSRNQTLAGWNLEDWPSHPQLGASFFLQGGKLWLGTVDQGSPIWEAGLSKGDEIVLLVVDRKIIYNRSGRYGADSGSAAEALKALQKPKAGVELYFGWKRPGDSRVLEQLTTLRERPIWRFFPTRDGEWVLWRYLDFLYDTSTGGDSFIGWQRNQLTNKGEFDVKGTPVFYRAEQFRKTYHNPEKVTQALTNWSRTGQGQSTFVAIEPPRIDMVVNGKPGLFKIQVKDKGFDLAVKVTPNSERQNQELRRVILWINDFQFMKWDQDSLEKHITVRKNAVGLERGIFEVKGIAIPQAMLRSGDNVVFVQCYNRADVRGESERILVTNPQPRPKATMHGLFIGVGNYTKSVPRQPNLAAPDDAAVLAQAWKNNRGRQYPTVNFRVLVDKEVTPAGVLKEFDRLAATVKPDDLLVFHLGGHGVSKEKMIAAVAGANLSPEDKAKFSQQLSGLGPFFFLAGNFNFLDVRDTSISLDDLYDKLVKLPCHKVITLDACNAAAVDPLERKGTDIIRLFTKDGVGPIIFAACKAEESAIEFTGFITDPASGLFAQAIVKGIQQDFAKSKKAAFTPEEMFTDVKTNVANWVDELRKNTKDMNLNQHPQIFLPVLERNFAILVGTGKRS